ncbi:MAG: DUF2933 domain-containing protein [Pseudazoarcus pumilus]|nr:DUF2933 domain-containing protein [Pseudazoarcus pumilus]
MCEHHKFEAPKRHEITDPTAPPPKAGPAARWALAGVAGLVAAVLLIEHREHWASIAPWLLVAACPLVHWWMHRHHHDGERQG